MPQVVSLTEAKSHLRILQSDNTQDESINLWIDAATSHIEQFLNQPIVGLNDSPPLIPADIKQAALLLIGDFDRNREANLPTNMRPNQAVMNLLFPYRVGMGL